MTRDELNFKYFEWMYGLVCTEKRVKRKSYKKLLRALHDENFNYSIDMDGNRAEDGMDLRYRFAYEYNYSKPMIATYLDNDDCSVFEMLVALAIRCEEHIMYDPDIGNRTGKWFWEMIKNLGLGSMDDENFDAPKVKVTIHRFLNREYERNGVGGLFTIPNCDYDLRSVEIWYQMCWYIDSIL